MTELVIYSKPECRLCDEMKKIIYKIKNDIKFDIREVNINEDDFFLKKYKDKIPVLTINGRLFAKYSVEENKLRVKLSEI